MSNLKKLEVDFCNSRIQVIEKDNQLYVAMRPICQNIGLQWGSQYNRIMRDEVLSTSVFIMKTQIEGDNQKRDIVYLPLSMLNGWLFGVTTKKVNKELKEMLIKYKKECYGVLFEFWQKERYSFMKEINELIFEEKAKSAIASQAGKILESWKHEKPTLQSKINALISQAQTQLALSN